MKIQTLIGAALLAAATLTQAQQPVLPQEFDGFVRVLQSGTTTFESNGISYDVVPPAMAQRLAPLEGRAVRVRAHEEAGDLRVTQILSPIDARRMGTLVTIASGVGLQGPSFNPLPWGPFPVQPPPPTELVGLPRLLSSLVDQQVVLEGFALEDGRFLVTAIQAFTLGNDAEVFRYQQGQRTVVATLGELERLQIVGLSRSGRFYRVRLPNGDEGYLPLGKVQLEGWAIAFSPLDPVPSAPGVTGALGGQ